MCVLEIILPDVAFYAFNLENINSLTNLIVNKASSNILINNVNNISFRLMRYYYPEYTQKVNFKTFLYIIQNHKFVFNIKHRIEYTSKNHYNYKHFINDWLYSISVERFYKLFWNSVEIDRIDVSNFIVSILSSYKIINGIFDEKLFYYLLYSDNGENCLRSVDANYKTINKIFRIYNIFDENHIPVLSRLSCIAIEWNRMDILDIFMNFISIISGFKNSNKNLLINYLKNILFDIFKSGSFQKISFILRHPLIYSSDLRLDETTVRSMLLHSVTSYDKNIIKITIKFIEEFENHNRLDFVLNNFNIGDDKNIILNAFTNIKILKFILNNSYYKSGIFTQECIIFKKANDIELLGYLYKYLDGIYSVNNMYYDHYTELYIDILDLKNIIKNKIQKIISNEC